MLAPAMNAEEIAALLHEVFPQAFYPGCGLSIERVEYANIRVRRHFQKFYPSWRDYFGPNHDGAR